MFYQYRAFIGRFRRSQNCVFTLKYYDKQPDGKIIETVILDKIPCVTGKLGYLNGGSDDWVDMGGGTPIGDWWIHLIRFRAGVDPSNTISGIGESWPIGMENNPYKILAQDPKFKGKDRDEVMIHCDNKRLGTAGCTATKTWKDLQRISTEFVKLQKLGIKKIPVRVFFLN